MKIEATTGQDPSLPKALLALADPSPKSIASYIDRSTVFIGCVEEQIVCVAAVVIENTHAEIKNIAVEPEQQGCGFGSQMIAHIKKHLSERGIGSVMVGTGNSSLDQQGFYKKNGFHIDSIRENYFKDYDPPIYENGIRCIDMVLMKASTRDYLL